MKPYNDILEILDRLSKFDFEIHGDELYFRNFNSSGFYKTEFLKNLQLFERSIRKLFFIENRKFKQNIFQELYDKIKGIEIKEVDLELYPYHKDYYDKSDTSVFVWIEVQHYSLAIAYKYYQGIGVKILEKFESIISDDNFKIVGGDVKPLNSKTEQIIPFNTTFNVDQFAYFLLKLNKAGIFGTKNKKGLASIFANNFESGKLDPYSPNSIANRMIDNPDPSIIEEVNERIIKLFSKKPTTTKKTTK